MGRERPNIFARPELCGRGGVRIYKHLAPSELMHSGSIFAAPTGCALIIAPYFLQTGAPQ
jgi:hypothetical protein